jgi:hypothetical protein
MRKLKDAKIKHRYVNQMLALPFFGIGCLFLTKDAVMTCRKKGTQANNETIQVDDRILLLFPEMK